MLDSRTGCRTSGPVAFGVAHQLRNDQVLHLLILTCLGGQPFVRVKPSPGRAIRPRPRSATSPNRRLSATSFHHPFDTRPRNQRSVRQTGRPGRVPPTLPSFLGSRDSCDRLEFSGGLSESGLVDVAVEVAIDGLECPSELDRGGWCVRGDQRPEEPVVDFWCRRPRRVARRG
jgi:hypothetical protein